MSKYHPQTFFYQNQNSTQIKIFKQQQFSQYASNKNQQPSHQSTQNKDYFANSNQNLNSKQLQIRSNSNDINNNTQININKLNSFINFSINVTQASPKPSQVKQTNISKLNQPILVNKQQNFIKYFNKKSKDNLVTQHFNNPQKESNEKLNNQNNCQFKFEEPNNQIKNDEIKSISLENKNIEIRDENQIIENQLQNKMIKNENQELQIIEKSNLNCCYPLLKYDVKINMRSVLDLESSACNKNIIDDQQGEQFKQNQNMVYIAQNHSNLFEKNLLTIGFLGQISQGKTFFMNSLFCEQQLTDQYQETEGICMKYHSNNGQNLIYIDSQGTNKPQQMNFENIHSYVRLNEKKNQGKEYYRDLQMLENEVSASNQFYKVTEQLRQSFIIQYSQILVIVISNITQEDVNFINKIQSTLSLNNFYRQKRIFVIHNLKDQKQSDYVSNFIEKLQTIFPLRKQSIYSFKQPDYKQNSIFIDNINQNVNHLIMARHKSEAGEEYNKFTIDYLKKEISHCTLQINFNVAKKFRDHLNQNIKTYLTLKQDEEKIKVQQKKDFIEYDEQQQIFRLKKEFKIEKVKYLQTTFSTFKNYCSYSIVQNKEQSKLYLLVQIPNSASFESKFEKKVGLFTIKIFQNYELEEQLGFSYISNKQLEDEYQIRICREFEIYKYNQDQYKDFRNGTHQFVFDKEIDDDDDDEDYPSEND
ncbi:hypothetical protein ABPG72_004550 [Tetrahymena utriculariae]